MTNIKFGSELTFIGTTGAVAVRQLPLIRLPWLDEGPAKTVLMGRNGRPRGACTLPGYRKGLLPGNAGKSYPPEPLTDDEVLSLLKVVPQWTKTRRSSPVGVRNYALIALLWRTGLRISEALDLLPHHVDFGAKRVTVLHGKGDKRRTVGIDTYGLTALQPWLIERAMLEGVGPRDPLFCSVQLPGRGNHLNPKYVRAVLHKYGELARLPKRIHPHGFRHSLACSLIQEDFGLTDVQAQLGHSSPATTAIYLRGLGADKAFAKVADRSWPGAR